MKTFCLKVTGSKGCFTRPETRANPVSYDVITPTAAKGIFDSIYWKPQIKWQITKIEIINPIKWTTIMINGVSNKGYIPSIENDRTQIKSRILKDLHYRIYAKILLIKNNIKNYSESQYNNLMIKHESMFERRAKKGQFFSPPYFGLREYACNYEILNKEEIQKEPNPIEENKDLGLMLYDSGYIGDVQAFPIFFKAKILNGIVFIPETNK